MDIVGIQIVSIAFSLFMIYFTYHGYRRQHFEIYGFLIWLIVFLSLIIFTLFPSIFVPVLEIIKVPSLFDFFLIVGGFFLITICYVNFVQIQKLKRELHNVVQDKALRNEERER